MTQGNTAPRSSTVIVRDQGFATEDAPHPFTPLAEATEQTIALDLPADADPDAVTLQGVQIIRIPFASFADGRGFTLARRLRLRGYTGRLRATGHVIADQYAMARRAGFDEVEIPADMARRQPQSQWLARANWRAHDYQARLRG
ncbi:MAG: DUF934 domain-containing protein [Rhodobacterales bacterium]